MRVEAWTDDHTIVTSPRRKLGGGGSGPGGALTMQGMLNHSCPSPAVTLPTAVMVEVRAAGQIDRARENPSPCRMVGSRSWGSLWANGRLPGAGLTLRQVIYARLTTPKAAAESQLRPIGLLPYMYRLWWAVGRSQTRGWSLKLQGEPFGGRGAGQPDSGTDGSPAIHGLVHSFNLFRRQHMR